MCQDLQFKVPEPWGIIILIANIISPGLGTWISAYCKEDGFCCMAILLGIAQGITSIFIIGWIWSIWHGYKIYEISQHHQDAHHMPTHH